MSDLNIIDSFLETFSRYIDSGFGLLSGDVAFLTTVLSGIDITLAGLYWALDGEANIAGRLLRKVLYVGTFALILNNFQHLAGVIYDSFAGLGLHASGSGLTATDLLRPGKLAGVGFQAAHPLLEEVVALGGFPELFVNAPTIFVLLVSWLFVIVAFFILAVQLFISVLEFKLTTLAGFVLVPFALWGKSAFLAERVLGNVISSGIKIMVLAIVVGIGSGFFSTFTSALNGQPPDMAAALSLVLASLALLGLGIFGPGVAAGLVSGAPQLGAGAALGTVGAAAGTLVLVGGATVAGARMTFGAALADLRAGSALGSGGNAAGHTGQATAGGTSTGTPGGTSGAGGRGSSPNSTSSGSPPAWASRMRADHAARATAHSIQEGERPGAAANPSLDQKDG
ncbi:type IV secretion system protein TrbL [Nitrospirillum amazonense]|uniref:Type IV secretion system protein TrbL n=1 Tax=Nitrospirillum amazonense TaxID=28077 RepID=A0A560K1R3_9PROT|nr:P-type conjugative transfer protein TrbL [Nitrospirillum amazonense]TWB77207.1 type IV secretion system protein TrbL [Nitrospirillum amazonense]